jgi:acetyl-CoA carboxylase carboxyl transferase subunit alpha
LENTWYSVISPESCSSILWRSWDYKEHCSRSTQADSPTKCYKNKLIDGIIAEPVGGAHNDPAAMADILKEKLIDTLNELDQLDPSSRIEQRIDKFCQMGVYTEE